jgi:hypothetical protein
MNEWHCHPAGRRSAIQYPGLRLSVCVCMLGAELPFHALKLGSVPPVSIQPMEWTMLRSASPSPLQILVLYLPPASYMATGPDN